MRTRSFIEQNFTPMHIQTFQQVFIKLRNKEAAFKLALKILNINEQKFNNIPFEKDKSAFVDYKYALTHFELVKAEFTDATLQPLKNLFKQSVEIIREYLLAHPQNDKYCRFAQSLSTLHQRSGDYEKPIENEPTELEASVLQIGDKTGGVEPGFVATHYQDLIALLYQLLNHDEERIFDYINDYKGNIQALRARLQYLLPDYMYKLDYKTDETILTAPGETKVHLEERDVQRTNQIKSLYRDATGFFGETIGTAIGNAASKIKVICKNSTSLDINIDAVLETLSNDFATIFMEAQAQKLFKTSYPNTDLKLMPYSFLIKGAHQLGSEKKPLVGSHGDTCNYRANKLVMSQENVHYLSDDSLVNPCRYLFPLIYTGDFDKVGSQGQNLLVIPLSRDEYTGKPKYLIFGIDFGHTLKEKNRLIESLLVDGRFEQPSFRPFKNFSALSDGKLREKMEGLLILARLNGDAIDEAVVKSYGDEFFDTYTAINSGVGNTLCENHIDAMQALQRSDPRNSIVYEKIIKEIKNFQALMQDDLRRFIDKFKPYLEYEAPIIDLLDNLNKLTAATQKATTLLSENGEVVLNHLCITNDLNFPWVSNVSGDDYVLSCQLNTKSLTTLVTELQKWPTPLGFVITNTKEEIQLRFKGDDLQKVLECFSERKILETFHPDEYQAQCHAQRDIQLQNKTQAPWFLQHHLSMALDLNPQDSTQYQLTFDEDQEEKHAFWAELIAEEFNLPIKKDQPTTSFTFSAAQASEVLDKLDKLRESYNSKCRQALETIETENQRLENTINKLLLTIEQMDAVKREYERILAEQQEATLTLYSLKFQMARMDQTIEKLECKIKNLEHENAEKQEIVQTLTFFGRCNPVEEKSPLHEDIFSLRYLYISNRQINVSLFQGVKDCLNSCWKPQSSAAILPYLSAYLKDANEINLNNLIPVLEARKNSLVSQQETDYEIGLLERIISAASSSQSLTNVSPSSI